MLVGGAGPRMLTLAGRYADGVALLPSSLHRGELTDSPDARSLANVSRQVARVRDAAGPRFEHLEFCLIATTVMSSTNREDAARKLAEQRGWQVPPETVLAMPSAIIGDTDEMVDHLERTRENVGVSYLVMRDSQMEAAAGLVARLRR
jgi:alkanesulfonate monooxygenase SsuD/methylene tetrahydromethanopterin reductase-like flavin-dependent oxidoreductase (luciferase family)